MIQNQPGNVHFGSWTWIFVRTRPLHDSKTRDRSSPICTCMEMENCSGATDTITRNEAWTWSFTKRIDFVLEKLRLLDSITTRADVKQFMPGLKTSLADTRRNTRPRNHHASHIDEDSFQKCLVSCGGKVDHLYPENGRGHGRLFWTSDWRETKESTSPKWGNPGKYSHLEAGHWESMGTDAKAIKALAEELWSGMKKSTQTSNILAKFWECGNEMGHETRRCTFQKD